MSLWPETVALVTGAAGFIGAHLVRRLQMLGARVHGVSRHPQPDADGHTWHVADLRDAHATTQLFRSVQPNVLFHLASEVNGTRSTEIVRPTLESNLIGAVNVLTAAQECNVKTVLTGSIEEPRPGNGQAPPPSPYAMAKWAATGYARLFHRLWDLPVTVLRPTMVYGPAQRDTTKLVPYVTLSLLRGEKPRLTSGAKVADWVYIDDVVEAFISAGASQKAVGHTLDVGTGVETSVREMVEKLHRIIGGSTPPEFGTVPDRPLDITQAADIRPPSELLGWSPATALEDGLNRTVHWYAEQLSQKRHEKSHP